MIPREAGRGRSFVGAGQYYLHDRDAATSERVGFTHTENVPTDDPHKALKWMAWTAIHAEDLKRESGATMNGQSCGKPVFTFSLSWHPEEDPKKWDMIRAGRTALASLGLDKHETLMVSHTDRDHPHMHVIVNVVDPETGKAHSLSFSRKKLSEWAEDYERQRGKIYCDQRVENNAKRQQGEYVKYREPEVDPKSRITELYQQSDSGAAFQAGLAELGYTLAQGKRLVLIDREGKIHSLSRQIDGANAKDIRTKLADLELPDLDTAREEIAATNLASATAQQQEQSEPAPPSPKAADDSKVSPAAEAFDRDQQDREWQESIIDDAIEQTQKVDRPKRQQQVDGDSGSQGKQPDPKRQQESSHEKPKAAQPSPNQLGNQNDGHANPANGGPATEHPPTQQGFDPSPQSQKLKELFPLPDRPPVTPAQLNQLQDRHLTELGRFYEENTRARATLNATLEAQYGEHERQLRREIDHLDGILQNSGRLRLWWLKTTGQIPKNAEEDLSNMRQSLENIEWRQKEARDTLDRDVARRRQEIKTQQFQKQAELLPQSGDLVPKRGAGPAAETNPDENPGPSFEY